MDGTNVVFSLLSILSLTAAGVAAHKRHFTFVTLATAGSMILAGVQGGAKFDSELQLLTVLSPSLGATAMLIWWAKTNKPEPMVLFWVLWAGHAWFIKAAFMQYP